MATRPTVFPNKVQLPAQVYICRVEDVAYKMLDKGYGMTTLKCAIASPESFEVDGATVPIGGRGFNINLLWNDAETWGTPAAFETLDKLGITQTEFEPDLSKSTDSAQLRGLYFKATLKSEPSYATKDGSFSNKKTPDHLYERDSDGNKILREYRVVCNGSDIITVCAADGAPF